MYRSQLPNNGADLESDPFFEDLKAAINHLVDAAAVSQLTRKPFKGEPFTSDTLAPHTSVSLTRHPDLGEDTYACWCGAEDVEHKHSFISCRDRLKPGCEPCPTVSPGATLSFCTHHNDATNFYHNVFCFRVCETVGMFYQFFLHPRIDDMCSPEHIFPQDDPVQELDYDQRLALQGIVDIHNSRVGRATQRASDDDIKYKALARFLTDMRREDIVCVADTMRLRQPWKTERVQAILGWRNKGVNDCIMELKNAMEEAGRCRVKPNTSVAAFIVEGDLSFGGYGA